MRKRNEQKFPLLDKQWILSCQKLEGAPCLEITIHQYLKRIVDRGVSFISSGEIKPNTMIALSLKSDAFASAILGCAEVKSCKQTNQWYEVSAEWLYIAWQDNDVHQRIMSYLESSLSRTQPVQPSDGNSEIIHTKEQLREISVERVFGEDHDPNKDGIEELMDMRENALRLAQKKKCKKTKLPK